MDWRPGDPAICIGGQPWGDKNHVLPGPSIGQQLVVNDVAIRPSNGELYLRFPQWPTSFYLHCYFVKPLDPSNRQAVEYELEDLAPA